MYDTLADKLNHLPHPTGNASLKEWAMCYSYHLHNLFDIFCMHIGNIEPFSNRDLTSPEVFQRFVKMLYKKSSKVI
jgi:hypothetical protein